MFKPHRKTKERVYHTEETKRRALEAWRANPTRPKAAIAREFGISPGTFNMWTHEADTPSTANPMSVDLCAESAIYASINGIKHEVNSDGVIGVSAEVQVLAQIRDELKKLNKTFAADRRNW